jgi:hypothetical protein
MNASTKPPQKVWTAEDHRLNREEMNSSLKKGWEEYEKKLGLLPRDKK